MIDSMWLKGKMEEPESLKRVLKWIMLPSTKIGHARGSNRFGGGER